MNINADTIRCVTGHGSRSGLIRDTIRRIELDNPGSRLNLLLRLARLAVVDVHVCHPHLPGAGDQSICSRSSLTESL